MAIDDNNSQDTFSPIESDNQLVRSIGFPLQLETL